VEDLVGGFPGIFIGGSSSAEQLAQELAIVQAEIHTLREANNMLSKCRQRRQVQLQRGGTFAVQEGSDLKIGKGNKSENQTENVSEGGGAQPEASSSRRCSKYTKPGYNITMCLDALIDPVLLETE
jgi:hypothetical protein